jgi:hypothetical protein
MAVLAERMSLYKTHKIKTRRPGVAGRRVSSLRLLIGYLTVYSATTGL